MSKHRLVEPQRRLTTTPPTLPCKKVCANHMCCVFVLFVCVCCMFVLFVPPSINRQQSGSGGRSKSAGASSRRGGSKKAAADDEDNKQRTVKDFFAVAKVRQGGC